MTQMQQEFPYQPSGSYDRERNAGPQEGDVIVSLGFGYGYRFKHRIGEVVRISDRPESGRRNQSLSENERIRIALETGTIPPTSRTVDLSVDDPTRNDAKFVIEHVEWNKDGFDHRSPSYWDVMARRLRTDGTYDPDGELINFAYMARARCDSVGSIMVVSRMRKMFVTE